MAPRQREMPGDPDGKAIVKLLDTLTACGHRQDRIFEDWLAYCEASLRMLPLHALSIAQTGKPAKDTNPEDIELFTRLHSRYDGRGDWQVIFARALTVLTDVAATGEIKDLVGIIYMAYGWPNKGTGQFFTPMDIAHMMAALTNGNVEGTMAEVKRRVLAAAEKTALGQAMMLTSLIIPQGEAPDYFQRAILPTLLPHIESIKVSDPCCGSGVMFLAMAQVLPRWVTQFGIVEFYGQDIDLTCVLMAKINIMIYGLNGWGARWMAIQWLLETKLRERNNQTTSQAPARPTLQALPTAIPTTTSIQIDDDDLQPIPQPDFEFDRKTGVFMQLTMFGETIKPKNRSKTHAIHT